MHLTALQMLAAFAAAVGAGAINSVAGGGTLVSFPTLVWLGLPTVTANATSTASIWPGALGSVWGYKRELRQCDTALFALLLPSLVGGIAGALFLSWTPRAVFDKLVPFLILFATLLFAAQTPIQRRLRLATAHRGKAWFLAAAFFQLLVGIYGGYFGAGIGIMMLAALGLAGLTDIHQMNALKNLFALAINASAAAYFMTTSMVAWPYVLVMALGSMLGGYGCAGLARRLGPVFVRRTVIAIGFTMAISLALKL